MSLSLSLPLLQVSQVYNSIHLSRMAELSLFATPIQLERIVVETARTNHIEVSTAACDSHVIMSCDLYRLRLIISQSLFGLVKT